MNNLITNRFNEKIEKKIKYVKKMMNSGVKYLNFLIKYSKEKKTKYMGTSIDTDHTGALKLQPFSNPQFDAKKIFKIK